MRVRLLTWSEEIRSSYWFVPTMMAISAIALAMITINLEDEGQRELYLQLGFVWSGGAEGARGLLSAIASSMITVAGVTFSITMVALSLASSQLGPQVLVNFMRDSTNQVVLGTFTGTFIYSLLILRTVRGDDNGGGFIPHISVTVAIGLALASLGVLIVFIHHIARSMQAPFVIAKIAYELFDVIDRLYPSEVGYNPPEGDPDLDKLLPENFDDEAIPISTEHNGYLQAIDNGNLLDVASEHDLLLCLEMRPGKFVAAEDTLVKAWPASKVTDDIKNKISDAFFIGRQRTSTQDVEFALNQLVEISLRSLSPSINDPFTAISCIDWIGAALIRLAERDIPSRLRFDEDSQLRLVISRPFGFEGVIGTAFHQIRQNANESVAVRIRLLETINKVIPHVSSSKSVDLLKEQAEMIREWDETVRLADEDRKDLQERYEQVLKKVKEKLDGEPVELKMKADP